MAKTIKVDNKKIGEIDATFNQSDQLVVTGFYGGILFFFVFKIIGVDSPSKD